MILERIFDNFHISYDLDACMLAFHWAVTVRNKGESTWCMIIDLEYMINYEHHYKFAIKSLIILHYQKFSVFWKVEIALVSMRKEVFTFCLFFIVKIPVEGLLYLQFLKFHVSTCFRKYEIRKIHDCEFSNFESKYVKSWNTLFLFCLSSG